MTVDSPLELYTTLFAWRHYGTMYAVIALTGLVFLPFFWAVVEDVLRAVRGAPAHDEAAILAHRPIPLDTAFALGVLLLAVMPLLPLPPSAVTYQAPCAADGQPGPTVAAGTSGTTYDQTYAALLQQEIRVPLWWRLLLAVGGGINRAAIQAVGCRTDIALLRHEVVQVQIQDPALFQNLQRFRRCFRTCNGSGPSATSRPTRRTRIICPNCRRRKSRPCASSTAPRTSNGSVPPSCGRTSCTTSYTPAHRYRALPSIRRGRPTATPRRWPAPTG